MKFHPTRLTIGVDGYDMVDGREYYSSSGGSMSASDFLMEMLMDFSVKVGLKGGFCASQPYQVQWL